MFYEMTNWWIFSPLSWWNRKWRPWVLLVSSKTCQHGWLFSFSSVIYTHLICSHSISTGKCIYSKVSWKYIYVPYCTDCVKMAMEIFLKMASLVHSSIGGGSNWKTSNQNDTNVWRLRQWTWCKIPLCCGQHCHSPRKKGRKDLGSYPFRSTTVLCRFPLGPHFLLP